MGTFAAFLLSITGSITARVLTSLGIGLVSYEILSTLASSVVNSAQSIYGQTPGQVLQLINLGGIGESCGIIAAALVARGSLSAIKRLRFL